MKKFFETFGRRLRTRVHIDTVPSREVEEPRPEIGVVVVEEPRPEIGVVVVEEPRPEIGVIVPSREVVEDKPIIAEVCNDNIPDEEACNAGKETVCGICLEVHVDPVSTTCKHTFCTPCLIRMCELKETARIPCPMCRTPLNLAKLVDYPPKKYYYPPFNVNNYPVDANFDFIPNLHDMLMISSAYRVVCEEGKWEAMYNFCPIDTVGFTWTRDPEIIELMGKINEKYNDGHSGYSMGYVLRHVNYIAKYGFQEYKNVSVPMNQV